VAAATSFLAALLMLTQRSLKRLLVLSTVEDIGFLLLGVASLNVLGIKGVIFAASNHALAKALLFACLSGPEADGALDGEHTDLAVRWRLYETAVQIGWPLAAVFILSSIFALIAYVLALTHIWWGPPHEPHPISDPPHPIREPFLLQFTVIALTVLLLAAGIWPDVLQLLLGGRP
jgi:formate hydrogenlyase subunit 3/multisubunit Na+/H+ antiporter MnhD subunit